MKKPKVIFVGSFLEKAKDGSVGGQMFACRSLIQSSLSKEVDFILIDSTAESVPAPPVYKRLGKVFSRMLIFILNLFERDVTSVLIFTSAGFSFLEKGLMIILASAFGKKTILAPRSGLSKNDYANSKFYKWYIPYVLRKSTKVICQGNIWKKFYREVSQEPEDKFVVIPNWIDTSPYEILQHSRPSSDQINILYLGWIESYKGIFDLINAAHLVKKSCLNFKIKICGMGSAKEKMLQLIEEMELKEYIEYGGWITGSDKIQELKKADIFILPSHTEGMPNALIEAMASSLPIIATKVGGIPELIEDNISGILVDEKSPEQLANALLVLLNSEQKRTELSKAAFKRVLQNNSVVNASEKFKQLLLS